MIKYQDEVFSRDGNVVPGAIITVYLAGTSTLATLYANTAGSAALANPVTADYSGYFYFYATSGTYDLVVTGTGITQIIYTDVALGGAGSSIPGQFTVDGTTYVSIQAAITAAGTTGSVVIPSSYAGTDTYTNPNGIQIVDLRRTPGGTPLRSRGMINMLTDCGLKGDGVTDDFTAAQVCFDAFQGYGFLFPKTKANNSCSYFFGTTLLPKGDNVALFGVNSGFRNFGSNSAGTTLCFAAGVTGIKFDSGFPTGASMHDLNLQGSEGTTFLTDSTLVNMTAGANLPSTIRNIATIQRTSNVLTVTITAAGGQEGLFQSVGSQVLISGVTGDATMNGRCVIATLTNANSFGENPTGFTCAQNGSDSGPFATPGTVSLPTAGTSTADGIRVCVNFLTLYRVGIKAFGRHGINADAVAGHGCTNPFADALIVRDSILYNNQGSGYYGQGTDSNVNLFEGNQLYYNLIWGAEDQSSLGNTWVMNNFSNNGAAWIGAGGVTPATKAINTISRTLASGVSTVTVVLSVANTSVKQGSCIVVAGVTDASFNSTAGQCYFVTSYTDSTHFSYEQPGAPANASSSGGTVRMSKFNEVYLSAGLTTDSGGPKMATQSPSSSSPQIYNYVEGGQICKMHSYAISIGGPVGQCSTTSATKNTFIPSFMGVQGSGDGGLAGTLQSNIGLITTPKDVDGTLYFRAGLSPTARSYNLNWAKYDNSVGWQLTAGTTGTNGDNSTWVVKRNTAIDRLNFHGSANSSGLTRMNSESTGAIELNADTNSGTGGVKFGSGSASPSTVATVDSTGLATFNGGIKAGASGSTVTDSRELIQTAHSCGTTTTCANTANGSNRVIFGSVALASASPSTATVASISPSFTSSSSYFCIGTNTTTQANPVKIVNVSSSSFTITGPNTVTDVINYICVGN